MILDVEVSPVHEIPCSLVVDPFNPETFSRLRIGRIDKSDKITFDRAAALARLQRSFSTRDSEYVLLPVIATASRQVGHRGTNPDAVGAAKRFDCVGEDW